MINAYKTAKIKEFLDEPFEMGGFMWHHISYPEHILICAGTSAGKTNLLYNIFLHTSKDKGTYGHITIVTKEMEPIYDLLKKECGKNITFYFSVDELPELKNFGNTDVQQCIVFDDCVGDADQSKINQYFLRGRKFGRDGKEIIDKKQKQGKGIQCIYLSQSYSDTPKFLRKNICYLLLLSLSSDVDLRFIMQNYNVGCDKDVIKRIFKNAIKHKLCFFKIKINTTDLNKKFSRNFTDYYQLLDDEGELIPSKNVKLFTDNPLLN